jgi:stage II sporulation protein D
VTRKREVNHAGAAWLAAVAGAWLVAAACRTIEARPSTGTPSIPAGAALGATVEAPSLRVGILTDVERVSIGAPSGVAVRGRAPGETAVRLRSLPQATFGPGAAAGRLRLLETGDELELAAISPTVPSELLQADASPYRGLLEVRPGEAGRLTLVNTVHLEDYLRGVVPNELSPLAFPRLEALKAQAVAARTYALAHRGDYAARGYDVCATPSCQVYRGGASELPLTDRAVEETRGIVATWRGRPINAYYTSTCGGHTEDGGPIFDDPAPYLRGVACVSEATSDPAVRASAAPGRGLAGGPGPARDAALLEALGVIGGREAEPLRLRGIPTDAEVRAWTASLQAFLQQPGCKSPVAGSFARRASFAHHLVASVCWSDRAERLLAPADARSLLPVEDAARLEGDGERQAVALLVHEGLLSPGPGDTLHLDAALTRGEALALLAGVAERAGPPRLAGGDLEAEPSRRVASADPRSLPDNWEVRLTPAQVARAVGRYGSVGQVRDIVPKRLGVSGRVVELGVLGSAGELALKGLQVRWGLGLRENLFVVSREKNLRGEVERFVITGKGWGHGVGLCQVGAYGMAHAGSTFEEILKHYYTGIALAGPGSAVAGRP